MTAKELLEKMREAGFSVEIVGSKLQVKQARWIDDELADLIRTHKAKLMTLIQNESANC